MKKLARLGLPLAWLVSGCQSGDVAPSGDAESNVIAPDKALARNVAEAPPPSKRMTREQLREQAKTDPDGADAQAISQMSRNELVATSINSAGFLCAQVTDLTLRGDDIIARCVEYRSGSGQVTYRINPASSSVEQID